MTQEELVEKMDVSANYIYQVESGRMKVGLKTLIKIKNEFQIDANKCLGRMIVILIQLNAIKNCFPL